MLVIEQGANNDSPMITHPGFFFHVIDPGSPSVTAYKGQAAPELAGREPIVPTGNVLGGGSSVNFMTYMRGQKSDFDAWNMPGWSTDELLPYFMKVYPGPTVSVHLAWGEYVQLRY